MITVEINEINLFLFKDGIYDVIQDVNLSDITARQVVDLEFGLEKILTEEEMRSREAGQKVKASFEIAIRKITTTSNDSIDAVTKQVRNYGSFRVFSKL